MLVAELVSTNTSQVPRQKTATRRRAAAPRQAEPVREGAGPHRGHILVELVTEPRGKADPRTPTRPAASAADPPPGHQGVARQAAVARRRERRRTRSVVATAPSTSPAGVALAAAMSPSVGSGVPAPEGWRPTLPGTSTL